MFIFRHQLHGGGLFQQVFIAFHDSVHFIDVAVDQVGIGHIVEVRVGDLQCKTGLLQFFLNGQSVKVNDRITVCRDRRLL